MRVEHALDILKADVSSCIKGVVALLQLREPILVMLPGSNLVSLRQELL